MEIEAVSSAITVVTTRNVNTTAPDTNEAPLSELNPPIPAEEPQKEKVSKAGKPLLKRGPRGPREDPNHPRTAEMVNTAILTLNERGGSSIQAIKKYIADTYKIDTKKKALFIKKYLVSAVEAGVLYRTRGAGAAGSFQISKRRKGEIKSKPKDEVPEPVNSKKKAVVKKSSTVKKSTPSAKTTLSNKANDEKKKKLNLSAAKSQKSTSKSKASSASLPKKGKVAPKKVASSNKTKKAEITKAISKKI